MAYSRSFLSEIHATDSTRSGCTAQRSAAPNAATRSPVTRTIVRCTSSAFAAWRRRLTRWYVNGSGPPSA